MKLRCVNLILVATIFLTLQVKGQFFTTGTDRPGIRWNKISTSHFIIVFPSQLTNDAGKLANLLENYYPESMKGMEHPLKRKFPVLLHNESVLSNGYVTLAPKRMELVVTPPQDSYPQDWFSQLTLHEFRHVVQLNKLNQGTTGVFGWVTGELASGIVSSQVPAWFYEGDAVYNETRLSRTGRGRIPGFEMQIRALLSGDQKVFSYDKAIFGSFRDFVPDHYHYGYPLVNYARAHYGDEVWSKALDYTADYPFLIWPVSFYLKKTCGVYKSGLYTLTTDSLKKEYIKQISKDTCIKYSAINQRKNHTYTNFILPHDLGGGKTAAVRSGLNDPGSFVETDSTGKITRIMVTGQTTKIKFDVCSNVLVWDEIVMDPRWEKRDYSVITTFNLSDGKKKKLTRRSRYFSPAFSPDGKRIAVAETDEEERNYVTIISSETGKSLQRFPAGDGRTVQTPAWTSNSAVVFITVSPQGKQLETLNLVTGEWQVIIPFTFNDISEPVGFRKYVLFRASFTGIENIYAVNSTKPGGMYQITRSVYGAYNPSISRDSSTLLFSNYTSEGFDIVRIPLEPSEWSKMNVPVVAMNANKEPVLSESPLMKPDNLEDYRVTRYHKASHLFHIHSWAPFYTDIDAFRDNPSNVAITPGFMLFSQNLLSTFISSIGYSYYQGYNILKPKITWRGLYPVFELSGQFGGPQLSLPLPEHVSLPSRHSVYNEYSLNTYIPLTLSRGRFITYLQPRVEYNRSSIWYFADGKLHNGIDYIHFRFYYAHYLRMSLRDLYPRFGQSIYTAYTETPGDRRQLGTMFSLQNTSYWPGFFANHSFFISAGYQQQYPEIYLIPINRVDFPRGYASAVSEKLASLSLNYSFPAGYPDLSIGPLLYIKRIRANIFSDISYTENARLRVKNRTEIYTGGLQSYGTEIIADLHLFRIIFPITAGIRIEYLRHENQIFGEFLLGMQTGIL